MSEDFEWTGESKQALKLRFSAFAWLPLHPVFRGRFVLTWEDAQLFFSSGRRPPLF